MNTEWFKARFSDSGVSMRAACRVMRLDIWSMSNMIGGKRDMRWGEAKQLSQILNVPLVEVCRHADLELNDDVTLDEIKELAEAFGVRPGAVAKVLLYKYQ